MQLVRNSGLVSTLIVTLALTARGLQAGSGIGNPLLVFVLQARVGGIATCWKRSRGRWVDLRAIQRPTIALDRFSCAWNWLLDWCSFQMVTVSIWLDPPRETPVDRVIREEGERLR